MISLKKSFEYQNYYNELLSQANSILRDFNFTTKTTENHLRSRSYENAKDEIVEVNKPYDVPFTPDELITFVIALTDEIEKLSLAIEEAKENDGGNYDVMIHSNSVRRSLLLTMKYLAKAKAKREDATGVATKFNAEGNQTEYNYPIVREISVDFNRDIVKKEIDRLRDLTEATSDSLDRAVTETEVDYISPIVLHSDLDEAVKALNEAVNEN